MGQKETEREEWGREREGERKREREERIFHLLVYPPSVPPPPHGHKEWSWMGPKMEARNLFWVSHMGPVALGLEPSSAVFQEH